jgi:fructokinase
VALVELGTDGSARYHFGVDGTADFQWTAAELSRAPSHAGAVHFGSLASWLPPGDAPIARRIAALRDRGAFVSYDPNVRPHLQPDAEDARTYVERSVALAHLVKTSEEDLAYLHPGAEVADVAASWLALGARAVVVTRGADGSRAFTANHSHARPPVPVVVVDTVGAGDAFMSGLLDALARRDLLRPDAFDAAPFDGLLDDAAQVAAITCSRAGANPPRATELGR